MALAAKRTGWAAASVTNVRAYVVEYIAESMTRASTDGNDPILLPFAPANRDDLPFDVEVVHVQLY